MSNIGVQKNVIEGNSNLISYPKLSLPLIALPQAQRAALFSRFKSGASVKNTVLDVKFDNNDQAVRGVYQLTLPEELKYIQLEVNYDILLNGVNGQSETEFFIEVNERSPSNPNEWVKAGELKNYKLEPIVSRGERILNPVFEINGQHYRTHMFNAVLSEWRGKEVQIVLTAVPGEGSLRSNGRWTNARLVGATFNIQLGGAEKVDPQATSQ